jgi:hypothetical protein
MDESNEQSCGLTEAQILSDRVSEHADAVSLGADAVENALLEVAQALREVAEATVRAGKIRMGTED